MHWMLMPYRRYAEFSGRSRRMEYWMFTLFCVIVSIVLYGLMLAGGGLDLFTSIAAAQNAGIEPELTDVSFGPLFWIGAILLGLWGLATIIPQIAVTVRRLHDRDMSGWFYVGFIALVIVLNMIPMIGALLTLLLDIGWIVLMALPGTRGPNKYGPDPLGQADAETFA